LISFAHIPIWLELSSRPVQSVHSFVQVSRIF